MPQYFSVFSRRNLRPAVILCLCAATLCFADAGLALTRAQLYQASAPIADRSEAAQTEAFQTAMKIVLVRVTGRRSAEDDPALAPLLGNARRYVQQYRGAPDGQVWVSFDGPAIERWLTQNGQPLWGHERPTTFVWLAAQTGPQSGTVITADDTSELKAAIDGAAVFRGVPLLWPSAADVLRNRLDYASASGAVHPGGDRATLGRRGDTDRQGLRHGRDRQCPLDAFVSGSQQRIFRCPRRRESHGGFVRGAVRRQRQSRADRYRGHRRRRSSGLCERADLPRIADVHFARQRG